LYRAGLAGSLDLQWKNPSKGGQKTADLTLQYISELSEPVYKDILQLYQIDFAIFGYQPLDWREVRRRVERSKLR
jgi:hypothetical protein